MTQPGPVAGRPPFAVEPLPPLRACLDLPLRVALDGDKSERVSALARRAAQAKGRDEWLATYQDAVAIVELVVGDLDGRIEQLQRDAVLMDDPNELRQRVSGAPRKEAEKARGEAKAAAQRQLKEWTERSRRQMDHVLAGCQRAVTSIRVSEAERHDGLILTVDDAAWLEFVGYVDRCCEEWSRKTTTDAEDAVTASVRSALEATGKHSGAHLVEAPDLQAQLASAAKLGGPPPRKEIEVPSVGGALLHSVRSNIMAVGMFGTLLAGVVALVGKMFDAGTESSNNTMLVRVSLVLVILPFSIFFGVRGARRQRVTSREKGDAAFRQAVAAYVKTELEKGLERHRKTLERWLTARVEAWNAAIDKWWDANVEPNLAGYDAQVGAALRDQKLRHGKMSEEIAALRGSRTQLGQTLLFDLRRRLREIEDMPRSG